MPVTGWRRPALAPVYALTTAFVVVVGIGLLAPKPVLMVRMDAGVPDVTVEVLEESGEPVQAGPLTAEGTYKLPDMDGNRKVCVKVSEPWRVTQPAGSCTAGKVDADVRAAAVQDGRVKIVFDGTPTGPAKVSLRDNASTENAEVKATGFYRPRGSLAGQTICVEPPRNWIVQTQNMVENNGTWCTPAAITEPGEDVEFNLAEKSLR